jgi:hypothetical protein
MEDQTTRDKAAFAASKARLADLRSELKAVKDELAKVHDFIDARREFVGVLRQYSTEDMGDYHRWTGHAEARRELAETLGLELDSESGGLANRSGVSL